MESPKRVKIRAKKEQGEDIISSLPDELIHHILSHLPVKDAVQTCVLSKRWITVWSTLPYLKFNLSRTHVINKFGKFGAKFLSNRNNDADVSTILFTLFDRVNPPAMNNIIYYAISHNLQEFRIDSPIFPKDLPPCLFSCKSLKKLVLNSPWICNTDQSCWKLNSLTTLELSGSILPDLPWSFPVLTTLHLTDCTLPLMSWSFPALTTLFLEEVIVVGEKSLSFECFVNLKNLTLVGCRIGHSPLLLVAEDGFPQLEDLNIDIDIDNFGGKKYSEEKKQIIFEQLISMFQELRGAKFLTLSSSTIKDLAKYQPCSFGNLKCLKLQQKTRKHSNPNIPPKHVINYLLSSSPGAMVLIQGHSQQPESSRNRSSHQDSSSHRDTSSHQRDRSSQRDRDRSSQQDSSSHQRDRSSHRDRDRSSPQDWRSPRDWRSHG